MNKLQYDIIIIGAGPAGCTCAMNLANKGLSIAIFDKYAHPREKICGDALSRDVINQLDKLPVEIKEAFIKLDKKIPSAGVRFYAPDNNFLEITFSENNSGMAPGYICKRSYFDGLLINQIKKYSDISLFENCEVTDIISKNNLIQIQTTDSVYTAKMIVGADGVHSLTAKKLLSKRIDHKNDCIAIRSYFENVTGFHEKNYIELHFYEEILPGYIWVFPMSENKANVGVGMPSDLVVKKKINLKRVLERMIKEHPVLAPRFQNAIQLEPFKAERIPLGIKKQPISGDRFLLTGDAASLVDPLSGEGVGNAIRSGRVAAEHILKCFELQKFSATFNKKYDEEIYRRAWKELKISHTLQKLFTHPKLINYAIKKANQRTQYKTFIIGSIENYSKKKLFIKAVKFINPFIK